jgi:hypothetical protein
MSRSNPQVKNPAVRFVQWGGSEGKLSYYDKDQEENIEVPFPFTFLVLDELNTVKGWNDTEKSSYWANEVRNISKDTLIVRAKSGVAGTGIWKQDLEHLKSRGAKYTKSIYIAFKDETGELAIGNFSVSGAALTAWIEFEKRYDVYKVAVTVTGRGEPKKKGATTYYEPQFDGKEVSADTQNAANALDRQLQAYLETYLSRRPEGNDALKADDYEEEGTTVNVEVEVQETAAPNEPEEKKIDLSDVPF